ncbi:MAG TPA: type VI secretion lipoprotein TssJ [archaeon]|nr:type VI secretion lipoprotein TssJ [archaeon]
MILRHIQGKSVFFFYFLVFPFTCTPKPDPVPVWSFEPKGIQIRYSADSMLNSYNGAPHTLLVVIYQMTGLDAFNNLVKDENGLRQLLRDERFDPSVLTADRLIIKPEEKNEVFFDRFENAKYLGVVAGYYGLTPGQVSRTYKITSSIEQKGRIRKKKIAKVNPLIVDILFGPQDILKTGKI